MCVGWLVGWLVGQFVGWLVRWVVGWLVGWLVGWIDAHSIPRVIRGGENVTQHTEPYCPPRSHPTQEEAKGILVEASKTRAVDPQRVLRAITFLEKVG
jgi:hypothetical protein